MSLLTIILLVCLILFRNSILIFFNNVYNLFLEKNDINIAEIKLLEEKVKYLEKEYDELNKKILSSYKGYKNEIESVA